MSKYTKADVRQYIKDIRFLLTESVEEMTDEKAMDIIETYVFSQDLASTCSIRDNASLIKRLFLSLRCEMDILQPLVDDGSISEIMVNGPDRIFIEQGGRITQVPLSFDSAEELEELIRRIAGRVHREINELNPIVDARLSDGSRVNAVYGSIALNGPILTIRKFPESCMTMDDLIGSGTVNEVSRLNSFCNSNRRPAIVCLPFRYVALRKDFSFLQYSFCNILFPKALARY